MKNFTVNYFPVYNIVDTIFVYKIFNYKKDEKY